MLEFIDDTRYDTEVMAWPLLEFIDDTRYDTEVMAWPHLRTSRIRISMKDYSKGIGDAAVDVFYNLSPEEFIRLVEALGEVKQVSAVEKKRWELSTARLNQVLELYRRTVFPADQVMAVRELIEQFSGSRNEVFSEAGKKLSEAFERLVGSLQPTFEKGMKQTEKILADAKQECENATKVREIYNDIKILNYDKYINVPYDNSVMESFFSSMKREELYRTKYRSETDFRKTVDEYIIFYNTKRPHRKLQYKTPKQKEEEYALKSADLKDKCG